MNAFQKFLSYLFPVLIERVEGELDHELSVYLHKGGLKLYSDETNYSFGQLHQVFQNALLKHDFSLNKDSKILILGFGVGSIVQIIRKELQLENPIIGVEKDKKVLELYERYFSKKYGSLQLVNQDARDFVAGHDKKFDLILIDLFINRKVPEFCLETSFLIDLSKLLNSTGTIVFNTIRKGETENNFEKSIQSIFHIENIMRIFGQNSVYYLKNKMKN